LKAIDLKRILFVSNIKSRRYYYLFVKLNINTPFS
jgi:hypothetical protein